MTSPSLNPNPACWPSVGAERAVYVWDVYGCTTVTKMLGHTAPIINVTIREHFNQLVTQSTDWVVRIWDAQLYHPVQACMPPSCSHAPMLSSTTLSRQDQTPRPAPEAYP